MTGDTMYVVERVSVPSLDGIDAVAARDVFGEQAEWGFAIPWMYQALAAPRARRPMLRAPAPEDDSWPGALAYWSALLHLLVYGFGWSRPDRGLRWWYDAGRPTDDPKLALLSEIWERDGQLDWFAAWLWTDGARNYLSPDSGMPVADHVDVEPQWLARTAEEVSRSDTPAPYGGGSDPLHLAVHSNGPLERLSSQTARLTTHPEGERRAALSLTSMTGWYRALRDNAASLPGIGTSPSWRVDVIVRPVGWLGTYRRSRLTGQWFSGRHRHHQVGH